MSIFDKAAEMAAEAGKKAQDEAAAKTPAATPGATTETTASTVAANAANSAAQAVKLKVSTQNSNLNIRNKPGMDGEIVGKAAHDEEVTLLKRESDDWFLIRTNDGEEGYASSQYLTLA